MNSELGRRVAFTLGALFVFRIGTYIPLPGIDLSVWAEFFRTQGGGLLGMFNASAGGAVGRLAIFGLGIAPYVSAAIIVQLLSLVSSNLRAQRSRGEQGRRAIDRHIWALAFLMAVFQAYGIAVALEGIDALVAEPGWPFRLLVIVTLTGGTIFLMWLAGQITSRGIGNGIALILCAGIVTELPQSIAGTLELGRSGLLSGNLIMGLALLSVALVLLVTVMEKARRREAVEFSPQPGASAGRSAHLSFKLNGAGVIPALIASWVLAVPLALAAFLGSEGSGRLFAPGQPMFMLCYAIAIFLGVYLYTAFVLDPAQAAESLKRYGGTIPQVAPGEATADHLDRVLSRVTLIGAVYFVTVCLVPELLLSWAQVPFYLGGASLLVLVCTVLDIEEQARAFARVKLGG